MRSALPLALGLLLLAPLAAAQAPDPVALACGTVGGVAPDVRDKLPVCPREDPAPAQPAEAHNHTEPPAAPPATPQDAQALAQDAVDAAQGAVQDPPSAPDRVAALVATVIQFVKDLLHLPVQGVHAAGVGLGHVRDATLGAAAAAKGAVGHALDAVHALFAHAHAAPRTDAAPRVLPRAGHAAKDPLGLVRDVARRAPSVP